MARYILPGTLAVAWLASEPTLPNPTQAEITAGDDLLGSKSGEALAGITGFQPSVSVYDTPDYVDARVGNVGGTVTYPQSSLMFYADDTSTTLRDLLSVDTNGFLVFGFNGSAQGEESQVFTASVVSNEYDPNPGQATMFEVAFSIAAPTKGVFGA